jgi:hypothetical protein
VKRIAVVLCLALAVVGCSDDGDDDAAPTTTTAATTTTSTEGTTTTQVPACPAVSVPPDAQEVTELDGDADGDGTDDELRTYRMGEEWHLQVELAAEGGADLVLPSFGGGVGLMGGADIDGDGVHEVWARTGSGASATIVGAARMAGCALERLTFATGELAELPVGGSVGTTSGVECRDDALVTFTATLTEGETYEVVATTYALDGSTLTEQGQEALQVEATDPEFVRYTSFSCGDLAL